MVLDVLLLLLIVTIIIVASAEGLVRTLLMAFILYMLSIILGVMASTMGMANFLNDLVVGSIGSAQRTPLFYQGIIFVGILVPAFIGGVVGGHLALGNTSIHTLKWVDNVLGTLLGIVVALVFAAVICNVWGVIVAERWHPYATWANMRTTFQSSALRPFMMDVLRIYRRLLFPFVASRYPIVFEPQG
jgi:hypothetical protein